MTLRRTVVLGYWLAPAKLWIRMLIKVDGMNENDTDSVLAIYEKMESLTNQRRKQCSVKGFFQQSNEVLMI